MLRTAVAVAASLVLVACRHSAAEDGPGATVVASFYPLAFVAAEVAGPRGNVTNLTPPGAEAHDVEPTASQVVAVAEADLVLYLGGGFQPSIEELAAEAGDRALDVASGGQLAQAEGGRADPHIWLDPTRMATIAERVAERLADADPDGAETYRHNGRILVKRLNRLDRQFAEGLAECASRDLVTSHEAFGYLASRYDLEQIGIAGIDPEAEPSPQRIAEVSDFIEEHGITTIFFETLVSPELAETIAQETGAKTAMLDPLEVPPERGDYFSAMRSNLRALRTALECR